MTREQAMREAQRLANKYNQPQIVRSIFGEETVVLPEPKPTADSQAEHE